MKRSSQRTELTIRPFEPTDADYRRVMAVHDAVWPDRPLALAEWKHDDATRDPKHLFRRLLVERDGAPVALAAYGEPSWAQKPGKYFCHILVHPDHERRGIGSAAYEHVCGALEAFGPRELTSNTREDKPAGVRFLEARGFERAMRFPLSQLDVGRFEPAKYASVFKQLELRGITLHTIAELRETVPDWERRFYDLVVEVLRDVPSPDPITPEPFERFQQRWQSPNILPEANFVARDGARWVGYSALWKRTPAKLETGLTGVVRAYRRLGVCTALKLRGIAFAQRYGARAIETENEEHNPMYQLNLRLGFRPCPAWLNYVKRLGS